MKNISTLLQAVNTRSSYFKKLKDKNSLSSKLFDQLVKGNIDSDQSAKDFLWSGKAPRGGLGKVKANLENDLMASIFVDKTEGRAINEAIKEVAKKIAIYKIMEADGHSRLGIHLLESALKKALEFELYESIFELSRILKKLYSLNLNAKKSKYYHDLYRQATIIYHNECKIEEYWTLCLARISNKSSYSKEDIEIVKAAYEKAKEIPTESTRAKGMLTLIHVYWLKMIEREEDVINICRKTLLDLLQQSNLVHKGLLFSLVSYSIPGMIEQENFEEVDHLINQCSLFVKEGIFNFFRLKQYEVISAFAQEKWELAYTLSNNTLKVDGSKEYQEMFLIYRSFASLMSGNKVRTQRIVNDIQSYKSDKSGMQFNLLVLELSNYLLNKDFDQFINRLPTFERYSYTYLNTKESKRQMFFTKAILSLEKTLFKENTIENKFIDKMNQYKPIFETEFINYNIIWNKIIDWLK